MQAYPPLVRAVRLQGRMATLSRLCANGVHYP